MYSTRIWVNWPHTYTTSTQPRSGIFYNPEMLPFTQKRGHFILLNNIKNSLNNIICSIMTVWSCNHTPKVDVITSFPVCLHTAMSVSPLIKLHEPLIWVPQLKDQRLWEDFLGLHRKMNILTYIHRVASKWSITALITLNYSYLYEHLLILDCEYLMDRKGI